MEMDVFFSYLWFTLKKLQYGTTIRKRQLTPSAQQILISQEQFTKNSRYRRIQLGCCSHGSISKFTNLTEGNISVTNYVVL